ncbi:MAG: threonine/serine exporter family protein [Candidatus Fimisoma sp.]
MVVQIIAALVGSVGFAIFFKMKGKQIALAGIGGAVTWMVYLFVQSFVTGYFVPYFAAAVFVAVYAEIMARINRAPATIFLTAAAVPLIPGGSLYYTMAGLVNKDEVLFTQSGEAAIVIALAIAMGFVVVAVITRYIRAFLSR